MGRVLLVCRLVVRDLRRRKTEAVLLLLAIMAATTTLTLGLALHGVTSQPYQQTRAATAGPDVVAMSASSGAANTTSPTDVTSLKALAQAQGVIGHSGPYPITWAVLRTRGHAAGAMVEGRDTAPALVDQPKLTQGSWVSSGEVVVERSFADALGVHAGDSITLNGRSFRIAGVAVTAAFLPYPQACWNGCNLNTPQLEAFNPGLIWLARADARSLATRAEPLSYFLNLKLADPAAADAFFSAHNSNSSSAPLLNSWQDISQGEAKLASTGLNALLIGSWLLGLLAAASVALVVGGRMAEQARRVGLLKAVGGTPGFVAVVLLAEYLTVALLAAAAGLVAGWLAAPLLTSPGAGVVGTAGVPPVTFSSVALVVALALAVAVVATLVPAIRAARTSTVRALADAARAPRRRAWLIKMSTPLPVPLLLGLRVAARRPRRVVLGAASIVITVATIITVLMVHAHNSQRFGESPGLANPAADRLNAVILVITVVLVILAAVNVIFITWTTALDARRSSALARALGATPAQVAAALSVAQVLPALPGAILGIPAGIALVVAVSHGGTLTIPPAWWLVAVVLGTLLVVTGLTAIPARIGGRRPVAEILQSELG